MSSSNVPHLFPSLAARRQRREALSSESLSAEERLISAEEKARILRLEQMTLRQKKEISRENRILALEFKLEQALSLSEAEHAELNGLRKTRNSYEEQYDPTTFTQEHLEFKGMHNDAFIQLSKYCERERNRSNRLKLQHDSGTFSKNGIPDSDESVNVFFLDGPDGGTALALIKRGGFKASQCYVANRHESSCKSLRISGGGPLPEENVILATAAEGLTIAQPLSLKVDDLASGEENDSDIVPCSGEDGAFAHVDFAAYYFDGCGGFVPHVINMISAALLRQTYDSSRPIAVGYSLLGGNKDVVGKELAVSRALTIIARRRGMRLVHVLDDPARYGISPDIQKVGGVEGAGTFTTWLLLEPLDYGPSPTFLIMKKFETKT